MNWFPSTGLQNSTSANFPFIETVANTSEQYLTIDYLFKILEAEVEKDKQSFLVL